MLRAPVEACGILLDVPWTRVDGTKSWIKELPNRSLDPASYRIESSDIQMVLERLEDVDEIAVWHTHPSGLVGPSRGDMKYRPAPEVKMLVVALTLDGPVPSWF